MPPPIVLLLCLASAILPAPSPGTSPRDQYVRDLDRALDATIADLRPAPPAPQGPRDQIRIGVNLFYAGEGAVEQMPADVLLKQVDALADAGVATITVETGLYPWIDGDEKILAKYDAVVRRVRERGMGLVVSPVFTTTKHRYPDAAGWNRAALDAWGKMAGRCKPETFVVVHDPPLQDARTGVTTDPAGWAAFARDAIARVKNASPSTRCAAGGRPGDEAHLRALLDVAGVEELVLGVHSLDELRAAGKWIDAARKAGKRVSINETWRPTFHPPGKKKPADPDDAAAEGIGGEAYQSLDAKWVECLGKYGASKNLDGVTFYWTHPFFKYAKGDTSAFDWGYNFHTVGAVGAKERTGTYRALVEAIKAYGEPPSKQPLPK